MTIDEKCVYLTNSAFKIKNFKLYRCLMANRYFTDKELELVYDPQKWQIISTVLPVETEFVDDRSHRKWQLNHMSSHPTREILFALGGDCVYGLTNKIYSCRPGSLFLFNSYESHDDYYAPGCSGVKHLWLYLYENRCSASILRVEKGKIIAYDRKNIVVPGMNEIKLLTQTWDELGNNRGDVSDRHRRARLTNAISAILLLLVEEGYGKSKTHQAISFQEEIIVAIQRHIAANIGSRFSVERAAILAGFSRYHFMRMFSKHTGMSFQQYIDECRIRKVEAMEKENFTKSEMSEELGFSHLSAFSRWLKNIRKR